MLSTVAIFYLVIGCIFIVSIGFLLYYYIVSELLYIDNPDWVYELSYWIGAVAVVTSAIILISGAFTLLFWIVKII